MDNYFSSEITRIEKELTQLKTSNSKSAGVIQTVAQTIDVEVPLTLNAAQTYASGTRKYRITPEKGAIIVCTLDWYSGNPLVDHQVPRTVRSITFEQYDINGDRLVEFLAKGTQYGANNDVQRLINGESVSITAKLTIRATCDFVVGPENE